MSAQSDFILDKVGTAGYFIDVGASDGINDSNTLALEQAGWQGICIDGLLRNFQELLRSRRCYCVHRVLASTKRKDQFIAQGKWQSNGAGGSGLISFMEKDHINFVKNHLAGRITEVETDTLESVFRAYFVPKRVEFLDIDVEGAAFEIIRDFPFNRYEFQYINVEASGEVLVNLEQLLNTHGYVVVERFGQDSMFCKQENVKWRISKSKKLF